MVHTCIQHNVRDDSVSDEKKHDSLLGYYDYTVILTYCGMLSAFTGIMCTINQKFKIAVILMLISGICDMFDGAVASTKSCTKSEKCFGIQIDSMSDLISFGVFPSLFLYLYTGKTKLSVFVSGAYLLCALIRLSYFNVMEEERQNTTSEKRKHYLGVPVTTSVLIIPILYIIAEMKLFTFSAIIELTVMLLGIMFIIPVKIHKPDTIGKIVLMIAGTFICAAVIFN